MKICCEKEKDKFISIVFYHSLSLLTILRLYIVHEIVACSLLTQFIVKNCATFINSNDAPNELSHSIIVILIFFAVIEFRIIVHKTRSANRANIYEWQS